MDSLWVFAPVGWNRPSGRPGFDFMNNDLNRKLWPHTKAIHDTIRWRRRVNLWLWLLGAAAVIAGYVIGWWM